MPDLPPDDFQHLPTADAEQARAAKAALWKKIADEKKRSRQVQEEAAAEASVSVPSVPTSSADGWAELFSTPPEELIPDSLPSLPSTPAAPARKRSILRRSTPLVVPEEPAIAPPSSREEVFSTPSSPAEPPTSLDSAARAEPQDASETASAVEQASATARPDDSEPSHERAAELPTSAKKQEQPDAEPSEESHRPAGSEPPAATAILISLLRQKWIQWGGASLSLSLAIHALVLGIGGFLVVNQMTLDRQVDFLPGGTQQGQQASQALEHKIQQKKNPWLRKPVPMRKIAAIGSISDIVLPDEVPDLLELPDAGDMLSASKLGGAGLGGGGFGKGMGLGAKSGMVFQPLSMFGREIKAKRLALVLDVSSSMAPYLPRVIEEVDKVARNSVVVLFPGCGLDEPPRKGLDGEDVFRTNGSEFERFWRMGGMSSYDDARKFKFSRTDPIPSESIFTLLSKRPQTYFIHYVGTGYAWTALLSEQVRQADALYWFSDFQDHVDFSQLDIVREGLMRRKQKLYIQPYMRGSSYDLVKSQLVDPTGGEVIEASLD